MGCFHWFLDQNILFLFFKIPFAPRGTTSNMTFLNTQNRPTLTYLSICITAHRAGEERLGEANKTTGGGGVLSVLRGYIFFAVKHNCGGYFLYQLWFVLFVWFYTHSTKKIYIDAKARSFISQHLHLKNPDLRAQLYWYPDLDSS